MEQAAKPAETPKPRSRTVLIAIVIIILIGVGGAVYYLTRPTGTPPPPAGLQLTIWDSSGACIQTASPPDCGFKDSSGSPNVTITASTTIQWTNTGGQAHTATSCDQAKVSVYGTTACPVTNASGLTTFDSGSIAKSGGTWPASPYQSLTAGTYYYFCSFHVWMHGKIVVQ